MEKRELRRRLWHISPGIFAIALWFIPHRDPLSPTFQWIIVGIVAFLAGRIWLQSRRIRRGGEGSLSAAVLGYSLSVLVTLLALPAHAEIALAVLAILAFGDGFATFGGLLIRSRPLPWNHDKSVAGLLSFLIFGLLMATLFYWRETHNPEAIGGGVAFFDAMLCVAPAVVLSAFVESISSRINDNIRVGITSAVAVTVMHSIMFGL